MSKRGETRLAKLIEDSQSADFEKTIEISNKLQPILEPLSRDELVDVLVMAVTEFCLDGDSAHLALGMLVVRISQNIQINRESPR